MRVGKFRKVPADRKRYVIDYTDWLNEGETLIFVMMDGSMPLDNFYVDGYLLSDDNKQVIFYVSGGVPGTNYDVTAKVTTSLQQIKEDFVTFVVT
ncbi:hypothetical protein EVB41_007 [Rhizobium phage RHph_TM3_14A]|nr:hypothetical protein EVB29_007 [Rhizobium phage RHph_TM27A]QIG66927.1 hypothetical protein EVB30_007 [Rhizobium phage RHph_TM27B]QIG67017.1 hypothetical protein EVB31_007 [Rhizobium phage RHph_TM29]QIG67472.1 hypothetical protein EVB41_007 [Rhizobium phage RHph_TM3_14A]